ncbi:carbon monoxide dehydrogenase subunit G [Planomonospora sp. ID67723]|uniref:SRPBCC family protein n=1 Tax=Planomonospora sp. ID67723 TaxID=2738134 RepID=UPI0018C3A551|nr:carbon monoxide dehydrogenase subunit G [Planomonospora sp. ID67723]MBG0830905.1 carbon monoxide dehydrogenase subunit G [Planomonospora sp. ID67723]
MKVVGSAVLGADRDRVWSALQDPAVLVRTIPGCERLEETGPDTYRMTVTAGVASIKGLYQGEVSLSEPDAPHRFVLRARGQGAPGTVEATVEVRLSEVDGGTRVDYDAEAVVGGMIGGVGQRMLGTVAKRTAGEFFSAVESHLASGEHDPVPGTAAAPALPARPETLPAGRPEPVRSGEAQVFERPAPAPRQGVPAWTVVTAFGMGAGVALGSAVIGWLLGRAGRKG